MRRCYRGAALALGGILITGLTSQDSCSYGSLTVYAAEDTLTEELETAFQEEVQTGEENVETDIPAGEETEEPAADGIASEEPAGSPAVDETGTEAAGEEAAAEEMMPEAAVEDMEEESTAKEPAAEEAAAEISAAEEAATEPVAENIESDREETVQEALEEDLLQETGADAGLDAQEYQVLLKIVEAEAGGEDMTGRLLVANVIMNRVRSTRFPNTVTEVVYQRCSGKAQFSPVSDGRIDQVSISPETVEAVARAIDGEDVSAGALYFRSVYSSSRWFDRTLHRVVEHGNHIFYTM